VEHSGFEPLTPTLPESTWSIYRCFAMPGSAVFPTISHLPAMDQNAKSNAIKLQTKLLFGTLRISDGLLCQNGNRNATFITKLHNETDKIHNINRKEHQWIFKYN
jgi:hypothetical protein